MAYLNSVNNNLFPNLPAIKAGWSWVKIGDVSQKIHYGYTASSQKEKVGPKLLRITDIQNGIVNWDEVPFCEIDEDDIEKYLLKKDDIVFARTGATVGKSFLIKEKIPNSVFASYLIRVQLSEKVVPQFIYLFFQSNNYWIQIKKSSVGIGQPNVNATKLKDVCFSLPPLSEQKKIVKKIEKLFTELESGVASLKKAKEQIKLYRQSVLFAAFSGRLVEGGTNSIGRDKSRLVPTYINTDEIINATIPTGWKWVNVSNIGEIVTGSTPSKKNIEFYGNDYPLYKPTDLNAGINTSEAADNISKLGATKARLLPEKSIMVTCIGATIGKTGMNKTKGATNQQINSIIASEKYVSEFVYYFCISEFFQDQIKKHASSTTLPILNKTKFESLPFIEVPKVEQTQIVEEIEKRFSEADNLEKAIDDSLSKAEILRQSILKQAFEGKLV